MIIQGGHQLFNPAFSKKHRNNIYKEHKAGFKWNLMFV